MLELFCKYKDEVKNNPILKNDFKGKDADEVFYKLERPLTMSGFSVYLFEKGILTNVNDYFANSKGLYSNYSTICTHIRGVIRADQISGGMAGIYNSSITQRLNGLVDKQEQNVKIEQPLFDINNE